MPVTAPTSHYRPGLDGLRALAVAAVVAYHLGAPWARGGFLGVDVFFVLSGFLITGLVLDEAARTGTLRMGRFLLRRVRRLLPALFAVLATTVAAVLVFFRDEASALRPDVVAALVYGSNWWSVLAQRPYAESSGRPPPLLHLWSLGIEEQFYLLWPLLVLAAWRWGRRRRVAQIAGVGAVVSAVLMGVLAAAGHMPVPNDPSRVYFGTDTHASGLLIGAALAALVASGRWKTRRARHLLDALGWVALAGLLVALATVSFYSDWLFRGGFLALSVLAAAVVAAAAAPGTLLGRALALPPLRWLGTRSYGVYLWHWPLLVLLRPGVELPLRGWAWAAVVVALTLTAAEVSYRWVEAPVRDGRAAAAMARLRREVRARHWRAVRRPLAATGAAAVAVVGLATGLALAPATTLRIPGIDASAPAAAARAQTCAASLLPTPPDSMARSARPIDTTATATLSVGDPEAGDRSVGPVGVCATASTEGAQVTSAGPDGSAGSVSTDGSAASIPPDAAGPAPAAPPPTSAFGDSVMLGAAPALPGAFPQVSVDAQESRSAESVAGVVTAAADAGSLGEVVVVSMGTNGPIAEDTLRTLLARLADRRLVVVLNDHVPRDWEARNNELLAQVVPQYPNALLADWHGQAEANPGWLWSDNIHLRPDGAAGFAAWLAGLVQARLTATG